MSRFDEEPDADPHGECAAEIKRLELEVKRYESRGNQYTELRNNLTELQYETSVLLAAFTDLLHHFTEIPSNLADTNARCSAHAARQRMVNILKTQIH